MTAIISVRELCKTYDNGHQALKSINLDIAEGEILALLGPNGAGKTTLISTICGIVTPTTGQVLVDNCDTVTQFRHTRSLIGLVPQELTLGAFDTVFDTVSFSRGLFGKKADPQFIRQLLRDLSLDDKKDSPIRSLSGGMKRRVLIAKALSHEPRVLFLDEPTAGVDVELRRDMWRIVGRLRESGVTIILTTHYIEEAEAIADRVGVINGGELLLVDEKTALMQRLGKRRLEIQLQTPLAAIPPGLARPGLSLSQDKTCLIYSYDPAAGSSDITALVKAVAALGLPLQDLQSHKSSLEEIFVNLVHPQS
ncbi:ABC transporter ATP-binding protein [Granulosicoccaceae sp. 1_MG-2023]|nr:ABC transporter ATP-binding protein [Granulosicoccaceae sp. 1_MG-2023]